MTILELAVEIQTKIMKDIPFKFMRKKNQILLSFYECDSLSVTFKIDIDTWNKIKKLLLFKF